MAIKVSVIIPTYNRAHCVASAVKSALIQTYKDIEIIVVDDGSTDATKDVLLPYQDKIKYLFQPNKGVSAARNAGIRLAGGDWIAFLDSDDEWLPEKLEAQIDDLRKYPEAILSCTNVLFESSGTESIDFFKKCLSLDLTDSKSIRFPLFVPYTCTPSVLAKRDAIVEVGFFDEKLSLYEDLDLYFRLFTKGGIVINPLPLAKAYRRTEIAELNLSTQFLNDKRQSHANFIQIYQKLLRMELTKEQRYYANKQLSSTWFDLGLHSYHNLEKREAYRSFLNCFKINPSIKTFAKMVLGLSGPYGLRYLEKRRNTKKGFRRSEYYQNESC